MIFLNICLISYVVLYINLFEANSNPYTACCRLRMHPWKYFSMRSKGHWNLRNVRLAKATTKRI